MNYTPIQRKCQSTINTVYVGIGENRCIRVAGEGALEYALTSCGVRVAARTALTGEFETMLTEWFFSGDWVKEEQP